MDDIRQLIRGYYLVPVLAFCKRNQILDSILTSGRSFYTEDFKKLGERGVVILEYLVALGIVVSDINCDSYYVSGAGRKLYSSANSLFVPFSYRRLLHNLDDALIGSIEFDAFVDREDNIAGSGATHLRYFIPVLGFLARNNLLESVIDVACGNGDFMDQASKRCRGEFRGFGVDLSPRSVESCESRFVNDSRFSFCRADGRDIKFWKKQAVVCGNDKPHLISMWFLLHELAGIGINIGDYLKNVRSAFPEAAILIGELLDPPSGNYTESQLTIMPEYKFFHSLSNQKLLDKQSLELAIKRAGFEVVDYRGYDMITLGEITTPSIATWVIS